MMSMTGTKFGLNMLMHYGDLASHLFLREFAIEFIWTLFENGFFYQKALDNFLSACSEDDLLWISSKLDEQSRTSLK